MCLHIVLIVSVLKLTVRNQSIQLPHLLTVHPSSISQNIALCVVNDFDHHHHHVVDFKLYFIQLLLISSFREYLHGHFFSCEWIVVTMNSCSVYVDGGAFIILDDFTQTPIPLFSRHAFVLIFIHL